MGNRVRQSREASKHQVSPTHLAQLVVGLVALPAPIIRLFVTVRQMARAGVQLRQPILLGVGAEVIIKEHTETEAQTFLGKLGGIT